MSSTSVSHRYRFAALFIGMLCVCCFHHSVVRAENVLLIIADDFGVDSIGLYSGPGAAPTPNLDALAATGVRFTDFWANPICSPTRAAILTGRHGFRTGVGSPTGNAQIPLSEYSIAELLRSSGYQTACIGKWHLHGNSNGGTMNPNLMGFDDYVGSVTGGLPDYFDWTKVTNGVAVNNRNYATSETVDDALSWIDSNGDSPWFCWLAFNAPHDPFHLPPTALHSQTGLSGDQADIDANPLPYYQAMVEAMDTEIGRLLSGIDSDVLADTTIIFIGDNGTPAQVATDFERGNKGQLFQGGVHVPCIISGASVAPPLGRTHDARCHVTDLFATIADLLSVDVQSTLPDGVFVDSLSMAPYLAIPDLPNFHNIQFAERFTVNGANQDGKTVRNARFKLIRLDNGNVRFFDLQNDPLETTNLPIGNNGGVRAQNFALLNDYLDGLLASPAAPQVSDIQINGGDDQRSILTEITIRFDTTVALDNASGSPFVISRRETGDSTPHSFTLNRIGGTNEATIYFDSGANVVTREGNFNSLLDGNYELTIDASKVLFDGRTLDGNGDGIEGDAFLFGDSAADLFFCFFGDTDGDRDVDGQDFGRLLATIFKTVGQDGFNFALDYNGDGDVDGQDYGQFGQRFFRTLGF